MRTYAEVQEEILSEVPLGYQLKGYCHDHNLTLPQFIELFLKQLNDEYPTYNSSGVFMVCGLRRRRTLKDIFLICRYYYPECRLKDVRESVIFNKNVTTLYCDDIQAVVNCYGWDFKTKRPDEYGWYVTSTPEEA